MPFRGTCGAGFRFAAPLLLDGACGSICRGRKAKVDCVETDTDGAGWRLSSGVAGTDGLLSGARSGVDGDMVAGVVIGIGVVEVRTGGTTEGFVVVVGNKTVVDDDEAASCKGSVVDRDVALFNEDRVATLLAVGLITS